MIEVAYADLFVVDFKLISSLSLTITNTRLKSQFASATLELKWVLKSIYPYEMNKSKYIQMSEATN